jgi:two-component system chemotaxis sensor kinase CheA
MRTIRARTDLSSLPIIAVTAKATREDRQRCLEAGASDYVTKPVDPDQLLSLMSVWLLR